MKLTMMGTGNANVTECYNTCFILEDEKARDRYFLVDAGGGNGILSQLRHAGIDRYQIRTMFISHRHTDHIMGGVWMMRNVLHGLKYGDFEGEATIYGNAEVIGILDGMARLLFTPRDLAFLGPNLHLVEAADGDEHRILGRRVTFFDTGSTKSSMYGFCMELDPAQGSEFSDAAHWPGISDAASGKPSPSAATGRSGGCGSAEETIVRRVLTFYADEPARESTQHYAERAEWALFEAFCLYEEAGRFRPYEKGHSTVKDACELAERLGVRNLVLYHTEDTDLAHRRERYTAEGRRYYHGNLLVPDDLDVMELG